jgi:peptidoglycan DL-endopeptidase CwlO
MATHRRAKPQTRSVMTLTASTAVAAAGVVVMTPMASQAATAAQLKSEVQTLQNQAEAATQQYDAAEQQLGTLQQQVDNLQGEAATAQASMNALVKSLGPLAASQYEAGSVDPTLELILSRSPDQFLQDASSINETNQNTLVELKQLKVDQAEVVSLQAQATQRISQLQQVEQSAAANLHTIQANLKQTQALYAQMTYAEEEALNVYPVTAAEIAALPTPIGRMATIIGYERSKLGDQYVYATQGPNTFDCSGLVMAAYNSAGISVPRSTYGYEAEPDFGTRIPANLSDMEPGDLIFYNNWEHVGTYVGNGLVIHSPHPGTVVQYGPWNMMSISAIIRVIPYGS